MTALWPIPNSLQAEIRRVLGYPDQLASSTLTLGYPSYATQYAMYQPYAVLTNKLQLLASLPDEAVPIFGAAHPSFGSYFTPASFALDLMTSGAAPNVGAQVSVTVGGTTEVVTALANDSLAAIATRLAASFAGNASILAVANGDTIIFYSLAVGEGGNGASIVAAAADPTVSLGVTPVVSGALSGGTNPPGPFYTPDGATQPLYGYLPTIRQLESDLGGSSINLDTQRAEEYFPRPDEMLARAALLRRYRRELADRLGVPLDPDIVGNRRRGRTRRI